MDSTLAKRLEKIGHTSAGVVDQRVLLNPTRERHLLLIWLAQRYERGLAEQMIRKATEFSDFSVFSGEGFIHTMIDFLEASDTLQRQKESCLYGPQKLMDASIQGQSLLFSKSMKIIPPEISIVCDMKASRPDTAVLQSMLEAIYSESQQLKQNIQNMALQRDSPTHGNHVLNEEVLSSLKSKLVAVQKAMSTFMDLYNREVKVWAVPSILNRHEELFGDIATKATVELSSLKQYLAELNAIQVSQNKIMEELNGQVQSDGNGHSLDTYEIEGMIRLLEGDMDVLRKGIARRTG